MRLKIRKFPSCRKYILSNLPRKIVVQLDNVNNQELNHKLEFELLKNFHEQFALNQNHHQALVIKFLAGLIILLVTFIYATLYQKDYLIKIGLSNSKLDDIIEKGKFIIGADLYFYFSLFICLILSICFAYITQTAYIFRRDQNIVARIREQAGGICLNVFGDYGQLSDTVWWPPDLFMIIMALIGVFILCIAIYVSCLSVISQNLGCVQKLSFIFPLVIVSWAYWFYTKKYKRLCPTKRST